MRITLGRCQFGINKMTICFIKKNGCMIRRSINTNAPSSGGNSFVSDGPNLKKIEKDLCESLEEDCQTVVC
jgi:hypothetical protein